MLWLKKQKSELINEKEQNLIFFQSIVDNVPNMIFVKDAKDLRFIFFNKAGEKLLGYSRKEMIGKNDYDFFPKEQAQFFIEKDYSVLNDKKLLNIPEEPIKTKKLGIRFLHTQKIPILDLNGKPIYLLGISEDITERKEMAEEISKYTKDLESKIIERTKELSSRIKELERVNLAIGRELKMVELKKIINDLEKKINI